MSRSILMLPLVLAALAEGATAQAAPDRAVEAAAVHQQLAAEHTVFVYPSPPYYRPREIHLRVGESVRWVNSLLAERHSVREVGGGLFAMDIPPGESRSYRFERPGEYEYRCRFHAWMRGRVIVEPRRLNAQVWDLDGDFSGARLVRSPDGGPLLVGGGDRPRVGRLDSGGLVPSGRVGPVVEPGAAPAAYGGSLWFLGRGPGELVRFDVASARSETLVPAGGDRLGLTAVAAGGTGILWLHDGPSGRLGTWRPATAGRVSWAPEVDLPGPLRGLSVDGRGIVWFVDAAERVGYYDPDAARTESRALPRGARTTDLVATANGVWIVDSGRGKVLRVERDLELVELSAPTAGSPPVAVAAGPGAEVWLVESAGGRVGRVTDGEVEEYQVRPDPGRPTGAVVDADRSLWLIDASRSRLARLAPAALGLPEARSP